MSHTSFPEELIEMYLYFERTYIGTVSKRENFEIEQWNQRDNVMSNSPRTNNAIEGWHYKFSQLFNSYMVRLQSFTYNLEA